MKIKEEKPRKKVYEMKESEKKRLATLNVACECCFDHKSNQNVRIEDNKDGKIEYLYFKNNFKIKMDNIPSVMFEGYKVITRTTTEFTLLMGAASKDGAIYDVFEELKKKVFKSNTDPKYSEKIEIEMFSSEGKSKTMILEGVKDASFDVFQDCNYKNEDLQKINFVVKHDVVKFS